MEPLGPVCKVRPRCPLEELDPLIHHLASDLPVVGQLSFSRGTMMEDGRLDLCKQALGPEGMRRIAAALPKSSYVTHLLLGADQLGPEGAMVVADLVRDDTQLETLYLGCNGIGPFGAQALAEALEENGRLEALWLKRNAIGVDGARYLARMLADDEWIGTLDLVSNGIGPAGTRYLVEALRGHHKIENLYLCANGLGVEGAALIAELIACNQHLKRVYLAMNDLGDTGAQLIADALREGLVAVGLASNGIGDVGAAALAQRIPRSLETLELGRAPATKLLRAQPNRIGHAAAEALVAAAERSNIAQLTLEDLPPGLRTRLHALLCVRRNDQAEQRPAHLRAVKSVYRTAQEVASRPEPESPAPPRFDDAARGFDDEALEEATRVLEAISLRREVLAAHPDLERLMVSILRGRRRPKPPRKKEDADKLSRTGIRAHRNETRATIEVPAVRLDQQRRCYVCKAGYDELHHFYDALCPSCADENWSRRTQSRDLSGRTALVTGGRIKIGYQAALKLLRAGANVAVTTRFPRDAARRYAAEPDFEAFADRLQIHFLDLLHLGTVEAFAQRVQTEAPRLDFLVNNAAQTVARPPAFYDNLRTLETQPMRALPASFQRVLATAEVATDALTFFAPAEDPRLFPEVGLDQPLDLRTQNSWRLRCEEVSTRELVEVHLVNALGPYVLTARLLPFIARGDGRRYVINVSAMEGSFSKPNKTPHHPHTNMAKAALNMLTRTSGPDLAEANIHMFSVDTGWITNENPYPVSQRMEENGFSLPLDEVDGAARILDPIFSERRDSGAFLKDYRPTDW